MSVVAHRKYYLADKKPFFKHFYARDVTITAVRSVAIQGLMVFNGFVEALTVEESDDEDTATEDDDEIDKLKQKAHKSDKLKKKEEEWTPPSPKDFASLCLTSFVKSLSITTCVRSLEEVAIRLFRPQIVGKLIKDVSKSATRKFVRTQSKFTAAILMAKTGMRSNILGHIAIFLIEETHQVLLILYRRYCPKAKENDKKKKESLPSSGKKQLRFEEDEKSETEKKSFKEITLKNATRSTLAILTGGVGATIGTLIRPGLGTVVGATIGDTIAYVI